MSGAYPRSIEIPRRLLLGQPVRVLPGQRLDQPRLAVVDVPRGADRQRHRRHLLLLRARSDVTSSQPARATSADAATVRSRVGDGERVEEQPAVADDADDRGLAEPQRPGQRFLDGAGELRELGKRKRSTPDPCHGLLHLAADEPGEPFGARANSPIGSSSIRSTGISARARAGSR